MQKGLLAGSSPFVQLIMLVFFMITCCLLFMLAGILLLPLTLGISFPELMSMMKSGNAMQNLALMRYMQTLQGIGLFIVPAFVAAYMFSDHIAGYLGLQQPARIRRLGATLLLMIMAMPCINLLGALNEMIVFPEGLSGLEQRLKAYEEAAQQTTKLFLDVDTAGGMFFNIFMIALLPALGEELIFRGLLQKFLVKQTGSTHAGIIIAGFFFSLMHMQFYGFFPRWLLGVMFGYLLVWSGTLWLPIFAHFVNNTLAVILSFLIYKGIVPEKIEIFGSAWSDIPVTVVAAVICAWILWKIRGKR